ncbi:MAG: hypothetical protein ACI4DW_12155 [Lachnospiraceae bacterium]
MKEQRYSVCMNTLLGKKHGILFARITEDIVNGWLDILGHREPFAGTIDEAGNCSITGTIITLMRTVYFSATGRLTETSVFLRIQGERHVFELNGISDPEKGDMEI